MGGQGNDATDAVVRWVLGTPVLSWRLAMIAGEDIGELAHSVIDMLDPERGPMWTAYLNATGADVKEADAVWESLGGIAGLYTVGWHWVALALMSAQPVEEPE